MKAKDITPGNEYAYQHNTWAQGRRVKVLGAAEITGRYGKPKPGWMIEFLDEPGNGQRYQPKGHRTKATSRQIAADWEAFDRQAKIERAEQAARVAATEAESAKQDAAVKELRKILADVGYSNDFIRSRVGHRMTFSASALLGILQSTIQSSTEK